MQSSRPFGSRAQNAQAQSGRPAVRTAWRTLRSLAVDRSEKAAGRSFAQRPRIAQCGALTMAKGAPWGSRAWTINAPPGTSAGPCRISAPRGPAWNYYFAVDTTAKAVDRARTRGAQPFIMPPQGAPPVAKVW